MAERIVTYPTDEELLGRYLEIEGMAIREILEGNVVGFPLLRGFIGERHHGRFQPTAYPGVHLQEIFLPRQLSL